MAPSLALGRDARAIARLPGEMTLDGTEPAPSQGHHAIDDFLDLCGGIFCRRNIKPQVSG
jgi:hypothetical protein